MLKRISDLEAELYLEKSLNKRYFEEWKKLIANKEEVLEENVRLGQRITGLKYSRNELKSKFDRAREKNCHLGKRINGLNVNVSMLEETIKGLNPCVEAGLKQENESLKQTIEWQKIQNEGMTKNRDKLKDDLKEFQNHAVVANSQFSESLQDKIESLESRHVELLDAYNVLEGIRDDETRELRNKIDKLKKGSSILQAQCGDCYHWLFSEAAKDAKSAKIAADNAASKLLGIQRGEYPWEPS